MIASLRKIHNPFVRSLTAAFATSSVVTLASAIAIGVTNPKNESAYKAGLYLSLMGAGCGALLGLTYAERGNHKAPRENAPRISDRNSWKDWRNFIVVRKVKESEEITSFYLEPEDKGEISSYQPGQFLTIKLDVPGQTRPVIRTYSLSDYPEPCNYYRLSIKREPMPKGLDVPAGIASNFMHDRIQAGSVIQAKPPAGNFVLDVKKSLPAVLISNGVGITPMICMAKAVSRWNPDRPIWFLHGARDGRFHVFREEVSAIAKQNPNLNIHYAYSRPQPEDDGYYQSVGYIDASLIQSLVMQEAEYFLCGSPPFMESIRNGLRSAGVPDSQVLFEMFTKASKSSVERLSIASANGNGKQPQVTFAQSGQTVPWQTDAESILEFAEANGLNPLFSCRQGICGTCQCKLLEGEVEYQESPTAAIDDGSVLICISKPKTSKVILDL